MQAYQSPPCPYCGITWNPPGAQACANCRNALPPQAPAYAPPGYGPPGYPPQGQYPGAPAGYPSPQGPPYAGYPPAGFPPAAPYAQSVPYGQYGSAPVAGPASGPAGAPAGSVKILGRDLVLPFQVPPAVLAYQRFALAGAAAIVVLAVVVLGVTPAMSAGEIATAQRALTLTVSHQARVDGAFAKFFSTQAGSNDPNVEKKTLQQEATIFADGLAAVQADEAALRSSDQHLAWLQPVTPLKASAIAAERRRLSATLSGLTQADAALTVAVNESNVALPYIDALIDYTKMGAALGKHDLVGAGAPYPDAQQKLELAMSLDHAAGLPPAIAKQVSSFNDALNSSEALVQALQAKDAAAVKKANDAIQAALKAMASPAETVPPDYESKTFGPKQKAYDSAIKALKS
ncbi:MAG: hypothetical protein ABI401_00720 [Candidatus Dormibacter sp.]